MSDLPNYIIHRSVHMNTLVEMVNNSTNQGYIAFGSLNVIEIKVNAQGEMAIGATNHALCYIQAMILK